MIAPFLFFRILALRKSRHSADLRELVREFEEVLLRHPPDVKA